MRAERLGERAGAYADANVCDVKTLCQKIGCNKPVNIGIGLAELFQHLLLVFVVVLVADADEIEPGFAELLNQVSTVRNA